MDTSINLSQLNLELLRISLYQHLTESHQQGLRTVLFRDGLGLNNKPNAGLIKSALNQWLPQMDTVIECHSALKSHGGLASTYVLLKKNEHQKTANREQHRKK